MLKASFRGYPLLGKEITLPEDYCGVILKDQCVETNEKSIYSSQTFDKLTYWNWDIEPSNNDKIPSALEWLHVAKVVRKKRLE